MVEKTKKKLAVGDDESKTVAQEFKIPAARFEELNKIIGEEYAALPQPFNQCHMIDRVRKLKGVTLTERLLVFYCMVKRCEIENKISRVIRELGTH